MCCSGMKSLTLVAEIVVARWIAIHKFVTFMFFIKERLVTHVADITILA